MDYSSISRALESLQRRQPPLDSSVLQAAIALHRSGESQSQNDELSWWIDPLTILLDSERWEALAVGLFYATEVLAQQQRQPQSNVYVEGPRVPSTTETVNAMGAFVVPSLQNDVTLHATLCSKLHAVCLQHLEHKEPRVRTWVAKTVGAYCREDMDMTMKHEIHNRLLSSIREHIQEGRAFLEASNPEDTENEVDEGGNYSRSSTGALDDTTGWRALETNWLCVAAMIKAMGPMYLQQFNLDLIMLQDCEYSCITHVNRHVRAAAMNVLEQLVYAAMDGDTSLQGLVTSPSGLLRSTIKDVLKMGIADNWSQVRMAASVLCRVFFASLVGRHDINDLLPTLLPRMCLNRFYLAQGVKLYSHETWKLLFPDGALPHVARFLPAVVRYYVQMCDADNHVVREAACQAISELALRLGALTEYRSMLVDHIDGLLQALLMCFHDESWPVRDEACLACGVLCKAFPNECRAELKTLWERWTEQLTDQIWSVRQDAAVALADAIEAYGVELWEKISKELIPRILPAARSQPAMTKEEFKAHFSDPLQHQDNQLYSCGSLAPKLKKKAGAGRIGCTNCGIDRPKAPWEATDGCIYLLREVCVLSSKLELQGHGIELTDNILIPFMTELADVCRVNHFPQAEELRTTLWKQLPAMAQGLGKQRFKNFYMEIFLDLLFRDLENRSASQLLHHAAGQCASELADFVGQSIFRGRLEYDSQRACFDRVMQERLLEQQKSSSITQDSFSPFGPPGLLDHIYGDSSSGIKSLHPGIAAMGRFP